MSSSSRSFAVVPIKRIALPLNRLVGPSLQTRTPCVQSCRHLRCKASHFRHSPRLRSPRARSPRCLSPSLSAKDLFAHGALQQLLGTGPYVKWSSQAAADGLAKAAAQATDRQFYIGAFNLNYSDSGLFGIQLTTQGSEVGKVLKAAMKEVLRLSKGVSDQDLARAKNQLKASLLYQQESSDAASEARALELLNTGAVAKADAALSAIDALSAGEVQAVAKKLVTAKMSMSAIGDLYATPYVDQLSA